MKNEHDLENKSSEQLEVIFELDDEAVFDMTLATIQYSVTPIHH